MGLFLTINHTQPSYSILGHSTPKGFIGLANENSSQDSKFAFVGSLAVSRVAIGAMPNSWVIHYLGSWNAAIMGCFLLGSGLVLNSSSAKSIGGLFFTNGIVGLGNSLCFMVCTHFPCPSPPKDTFVRLAEHSLPNGSNEVVVLPMAWFLQAVTSVVASRASSCNSSSINLDIYGHFESWD